MSTELQFLCLMKFINQQILGANRDYHFSVFSKYLFLSWRSWATSGIAKTVTAKPLKIGSKCESRIPWKKALDRCVCCTQATGQEEEETKTFCQTGSRWDRAWWYQLTIHRTEDDWNLFVWFDIRDGLAWFVKWPNRIESVSHEHEILKGKNKTKLTII